MLFTLLLFYLHIYYQRAVVLGMNAIRVAIHASRACTRSAVCVSIRTQPYPVDPPDRDQSGPYGLQGCWQLRSLQGTHGLSIQSLT